uniref:Uncharacterized protein n=1 Tax=Enterococcus faecalis TaxID=1351 RepID=Q8GR42_ENTFL|nr:hypothetical protein [Enterococcus faecalis]
MTKFSIKNNHCILIYHFNFSFERLSHDRLTMHKDPISIKSLLFLAKTQPPKIMIKTT